MCKRHGAKPVTQYRDEGYLPEAMVNYLARLGWSHGDDEIFSREQFLQWFDLDHLGKSAGAVRRGQAALGQRAAHEGACRRAAGALVGEQLQQPRHRRRDARLPRLCALFKDRCDTTVALADWAHVLRTGGAAQRRGPGQHITEGVRPALSMLAKMLEGVEWDKAAIAAAIKEMLRAHGLKMPQLAMPVRVLVLGRRRRRRSMRCWSCCLAKVCG